MSDILEAKENNIEIQEQVVKNTKNKKKTKPKKDKYSRTGAIKFFQHILIVTVLVAAFIFTTSSSIMVKTATGSQTYSLSASDEGRNYEDSILFNTVLGKEAGDVLRFVTIRSQLETNGAYDPNIVIDVVKYNSRAEGSSLDNSNNITAKYFLGDLLKWSRYGFEYNTVERSQITPMANDLIYNQYDGASYTELEDPSQTYDLLINRYKTIDGYGVEELATTWSEYYYIVDQLMNAADSLYINYSDYLKLCDYYKTSSSNIRYYVIDNSDIKSPIIYTNTGIKDTDLMKVKETFKGYGRYLSFNHDTFVYNTNTAINESTFNSLMSKYEYAYPDKCNIYIAADMTMPARDSIYTSARGYNNYLPYYKGLIGLIIACSVLYFALLILGTIKEGLIRNADGSKSIKLTSFDNTPIEFLLCLIAIVIVFIPLGVISVIIDYYKDILTISSDLYVRIAIGVIVFIYDIIILSLYYSLVRRIKGRNIWSYSLLNKLIQYCRNALLSIYDNSNVIIRSWVPYGCLGFINLILVFLCIKLTPIFVLLLLAIDIAAGVMIYKQVNDRSKLIESMKKIVDGEFGYKLPTDDFHGDNIELAECVNSIGDSIKGAVEQSMKDERMKSDLIANVSHDIRTPLTSIINYVDLIKRENITDPNVISYIQIIDEKSQRLKTLTDDLIEASKVSSGTIEIDLQRMNLPELLNQALAEFADKFEARELTCVCRSDEATNTTIMADGKSLWRVIENLFSNVCKYALPKSRVFIDLFNVKEIDREVIVLQIKNISENPLPNDLNMLTERFIRGDESRTSEGSGLGLSIAKSLTELMGGSFELASDADLFKVELGFTTCK